MRRVILSAVLAGIMASTGYAQNAAAERERAAAEQEEYRLPKFDLDFPGGTPQQLADAIRKEVGTLNVVIPEEHKKVILPPVKMRQVDARQLFDALYRASQRRVQTANGRFSSEMFGFRTVGVATPQTVWYFEMQKSEPAREQRSVRYFQMASYLTQYKIDDITTAIQAGWKMPGDPDVGQLSFHEDTKLLIAMGTGEQLNMIASVLAELDKTLKHEMKGVVKGAPDSEKATK
jgi:hypothetical protein